MLSEIENTKQEIKSAAVAAGEPLRWGQMDSEKMQLWRDVFLRWDHLKQACPETAFRYGMELAILGPGENFWDEWNRAWMRVFGLATINEARFRPNLIEYLKSEKGSHVLHHLESLAAFDYSRMSPQRLISVPGFACLAMTLSLSQELSHQPGELGSFANWGRYRLNEGGSTNLANRIAAFGDYPETRMTDWYRRLVGHWGMYIL